MSILLQALKKSEMQRELGSVPTLQTHTDLLASGDSATPLWLPALLAVSAAVLIAWFGLEQYRVPEGLLDRIMVQQDSPDAGQSKAGQAADAQSDTLAASAAPDAAPVQPQNSILPRISETAVTNTNTNPNPEPQQEQRRLGREVRNYAAEKPAPRIAADSAPKRENAVRSAEVAKVELERAQTAVPTQQSESARADQASTPAEAYEPEMISYWQVPEKTREGLPDLRISVLVFAEQPENRFLLLNGERMREGETLPNGLLLEEIRRDRAVFNYRNYRFFLKG